MSLIIQPRSPGLFPCPPKSPGNEVGDYWQFLLFTLQHRTINVRHEWNNQKLIRHSFLLPRQRCVLYGSKLAVQSDQTPKGPGSQLKALFGQYGIREILRELHSPNLPKEKCISVIVRIGVIIIFHLSKLWKTKFSILCDVIFLVRLQFEIDHSWGWKG